MAEENQVTTKAKAEENQMTEQTTKEVQQVTTKDPKKVEVGKRLAEYNRTKREELKVQKSEVSQYYGIGAVLAVGVIGCLGYYLYQAKKVEVNIVPNHQPPQQPSPKTNKFEME